MLCLHRCSSCCKGRRRSSVCLKSGMSCVASRVIGLSWHPRCVLHKVALHSRSGLLGPNSVQFSHAKLVFSLRASTSKVHISHEMGFFIDIRRGLFAMVVASLGHFSRSRPAPGRDDVNQGSGSISDRISICQGTYRSWGAGWPGTINTCMQ
jgi:hypothetical protein